MLLWSLLGSNRASTLESRFLNLEVHHNSKHPTKITTMKTYMKHLRICDGNVFLFVPKSSKKQIWQVRIKLPGVSSKEFCFRKSLKTSNQREAITLATALFNEQQSVFIGNDRKQDLSWIDLVGLYEEHFPDKTKFQYDSKTYLTPFFGHITNIKTIDTTLCRKFWFWREDIYKDWEKPTFKTGDRQVFNAAVEPHQNTLKALEVSLKSALMWAHQQGLIQSVPNFSIPKPIWKRAPSANTRGVFDLPSYKRLVIELRKRSKLLDKRESKRGNLKQQIVGLERVRFAVLLIANTAVRPTEMLKLRHRDITLRKGDSKEEKQLGISFTQINISKKSSKTNTPRIIISHNYRQDGKTPYDTYAYFERFTKIKDEYDLPTDPNALIFGSTRNPDVAPKLSTYFRNLLEDFNLLVDDEGRNRVMYSLRGFAISMALEREVPIHIVARNAGTSVRIIEKNYWRALSWSLRSVITKNHPTATNNGLRVIAPLSDKDEQEIINDSENS